MKILTFDFETFYSKVYSLSKVTTEEYVRHEDFEVICVSVKDGDQPAKCVSGTHSEIKAFLKLFPWEDSIAIAHNAVFDMAILNWHFSIQPKRIVDTLSMARALGHGSVSLAALVTEYGLGAKGTAVLDALGKRRVDFTQEEMEDYASYCNNDVELTYKLFLAMADGFPIDEFRLIDLTIRMFTEPTLELVKSRLDSHLREVVQNKLMWMNEVSGGITRENLMSNQQLAMLLTRFAVEVPMKISPTTGKQAYAFSKTDEAFKELLDHENRAVQAIVAARLGIKSTLEETRTERFIGIAKRGTLPIPLRYYAAHTGRWGGDDKVNMQNLPRISPLKKAIIAPQGYVILDSDSSQIEARTLAWLAGQDDLVDAFERGEDVYRIMAAKIYGKEPEDVTKDERFVGKTVILGAGYGTGWAKLQSALKTATPSISVNEDEARSIIATYRETYPRIPALWREATEAVKAILGDVNAPLGREDVLVVEGNRGIRLPNGLYLRYPNLRWQEDEESGKTEFVYDTKRGRAVIPNRIYGAKVVENVCQALARIVIGEQMLLIAKKYRVVMTVHDAIACIVKEDEADNAKEFVEMCMRMRPMWALDLPLNCEAGYGLTYGDCK